MSTSITLRGVQLLPLWKRRIPKYPLYWKGDPQLRVFLPQFWMKILKPEKDIPSNQVHFEVHPQMSDVDIKNYLEKIYKVPVLSVKTKLIKGDEVKGRKHNQVVNREPERRLAYLVLEDGHEFSFPDIFKENLAPMEKEVKEMDKIKRINQIEEQKSWERASVPPWFRH
jgi:large subunit ribosomal protein L23